MKRALMAVVIAVGLVASAADVLFSTTEHYETTKACSALDGGLVGADMQNATGFNVVVSAPRLDAGVQTLFATGRLDCCAYLPVSTGGNGKAQTKRWLDCPASLDVQLSSTCWTGARDCSSGDYEPLAGQGRIAFPPNGVLVDGGNTVNVTINVRRKP